MHKTFQMVLPPYKYDNSSFLFFHAEGHKAFDTQTLVILIGKLQSEPSSQMIQYGFLLISLECVYFDPKSLSFKLLFRNAYPEKAA